MASTSHRGRWRGNDRASSPAAGAADPNARGRAGAHGLHRAERIGRRAAVRVAARSSHRNLGRWHPAVRAAPGGSPPDRLESHPRADGVHRADHGRTRAGHGPAAHRDGSVGGQSPFGFRLDHRSRHQAGRPHAPGRR